MYTLTLLTLLSTILPTVLGACTQFSPSVYYTNLDANISASQMNSSFPPIRVSKIISCTAETAGSCPPDKCLLSGVSNLLVRVDRQLDLNVSEAVADSIFDLVRPDFLHPGLVNTNASLVYYAGVPGVAYCVEQGTSAWFGYKPFMDCVSGRLSGCTGGDVEDGTVVRACAVQVREGTTDDRIPRLDWGNITVMREPVGTVEGGPVNATLDEAQAQRSDAVGMVAVGKGRVVGLIGLVGVLGLGMVL